VAGPRRDVVTWTTAAGAALLVAIALTARPRPHGDAGEYLLTLESWAAHLSPDLRPRDLEALRSLLRDAAPSLDEDGILPNFHRGRDRRLYGYHFWAYPLAGLPARLLLPRLGLDPLKALPVTNALFFATALLAAAHLGWDRARTGLLVGLLLLSPALAFLLWPHPEVMSFALVTVALALAAAGRSPAAVLAAALASLQNPPIVLLAALLWLEAAWAARRPAQRGRALLAVLAALPAVLPAVFFLWQFGVFNLSVRPSEARASLSLARSSDLLVDPNLGMLWHAPLTVALCLAGGWRWRRQARPLPAWTLVALLALLAIACTANSNWNNDTSGPSRYVAWMFPLAAFVAAAETGGPPSRPLRRAPAALLSLALLTQGVILLARGGPFAPSDYLEHSPAARYVLGRWPRLYRPTPEVFVERTLHREEPPEGPVVYRDAYGRCRKAWAQGRHAGRLEEECGPPVLSRRPDAGRREWGFVDY
jgi:hypothetical protein